MRLIYADDMHPPPLSLMSERSRRPLMVTQAKGAGPGKPSNVMFVVHYLDLFTTQQETQWALDVSRNPTRAWTPELALDWSCVAQSESQILRLRGPP